MDPDTILIKIGILLDKSENPSEIYNSWTAINELYNEYLPFHESIGKKYPEKKVEIETQFKILHDRLINFSGTPEEIETQFRKFQSRLMGFYK